MEMILVSPRWKSSPEGRSEKREITPSPESALSKNLLLIAPVTAAPIQPQRLFAPSARFATEFVSGGDAVIEQRRPLHRQHGHPDPEPEPEPHSPVAQKKTLPFSRQVMFPFNLRQTPSEFHAKENTKLLFDVFPGTRKIDFDDRVLVYHLDSLPAKPWPKKIAGVPCYLTSDPDDQGPIIPIRHRGRSQITVSNHLDLRNNEAAVGLVFDLVRDFFARTDIPITEIQFWGHLIIIVLENDTGNVDILSSVPRSVAHCNCFYLFESDMARPRILSALRHRPASLDQVDDSQYDILRPGVMLSSGKHPQEGWELLTSSGVVVKDRLGFKYMTAAAHGFPGHPFDGKVHHPRSSRRMLGEAVIELCHTDVALVELDEGVEFINEPFENTVSPTPPTRLTGFLQAAETRIGDDIFLDSPFSGFAEGTRGAHSLLRVTSDDPQELEQTWIRCQWHYMGQGSSQEMVDGMCGSAIWDENHKVIGFFRYAPSSGVLGDWCMSIAADHLLDKGYSMA